MANKTSLREFQAYLTDRLSTAAGGQREPAWLGLLVGEDHWLIDLADGGEIVQSPQVTPVPMTRPWFLGVANVRGNLFAVTDFSAFCGGRPTAIDLNSRLVLIGQRYGSNVALLVSRVIGLRKPGEFSPAETDPERPVWRAEVHADKHGTRWQKLTVRALLNDPHFMEIGA